MGRKKVYGNCRICGKHGKLSFEHVPPRNAFNKINYSEISYSLFRENLLDILDLDGNNESKVGRLKQGGIGFNTLCVKCNNDTGSWYGGDFVSWTYQTMALLQKANGKPTLYYPSTFYPLRVIKQIVTMFFSINTKGFSSLEPDLVKFILNKKYRFLNSKYRIYCYYNLEGNKRYLGNTFIGELGKSEIIHSSEITFPPFGFVMTIDSKKPDERLNDISHFANFDYDYEANYYQKIQALPTYLPHIPNDYREKEEFKRIFELKD